MREERLGAGRALDELRSVAKHLRRCGEAGLKFIPVVARGKQPARGYSHRTPFDDASAAISYLRRHRDTNFGLVTGPVSEIFVLDVDGERGRDSLRRLLDIQGVRLPNTVQVDTPNGMHIYFGDRGRLVRNSVGRLGPGLDVRGMGGHVVAPGSIGEDGELYRYRDGRSLDQISIAKAPPWLLAKVEAKPTLEPSDISRSSAVRSPSAYGRAGLERLAGSVAGSVSGTRNNEANRAAFKAGQLVSAGTLSPQDAEGTLVRAAMAAGLSEDESRKTVRGGLAAGEKFPRPMTMAAPAECSATPDPYAERLSALGTSDIDNAVRFVERFRDKIAFTSAYGWMKYEGGRWKPDATTDALACAMETATLIAEEIQHKADEAAKRERSAHARRSRGRSPIDAMMRLAEPGMKRDAALFDRQRMLLNVANGTIDLKTGQLRPHDPDDHITKIAPIYFDPDAQCPRFKKFMHWICHGDAERGRYLQRVFGYCLTGETREQVFFYVVGPGRTGKSVLMRILRVLLGEYAAQSEMKTFLVKQYDNEIPEDIARLRGLRVAVAAEANIDRQIDEAKIKTLTGQDVIVARKMRQNSFQFEPEFKLWLVANHFPRVRESGHAFWRRVQVIPMDRIVSDDEVDQDLADKLLEELPGILAWAARGCESWQRKGLDTPESIQGETARWRGFADRFDSFLGECCVLEPSASVQSSVLYNAYRTWCNANGEAPQSASGLKIKLDEKDLRLDKRRIGNFYVGIRLKTGLR